MTSLDRLLLISSLPLCEHTPEIFGQTRKLAGKLADELLGMLLKCNGFYAFESSLHVFPTHSDQLEIGISDWNDNALWCSAYKGLADECLFFAEDAFGGQFCIKDNSVFTFDPETGELEYLADDIEGWARILLSDYEILTGLVLAHQWQKNNGQVPVGKRLLPKVPFVLGGEYSLSNLYLSDSVRGMKIRAHIAHQIKNLPDGAQVKFEIEG